MSAGAPGKEETGVPLSLRFPGPGLGTQRDLVSKPGPIPDAREEYGPDPCPAGATDRYVQLARDASPWDPCKAQQGGPRP